MDGKRETVDGEKRDGASEPVAELGPAIAPVETPAVDAADLRSDEEQASLYSRCYEWAGWAMGDTLKQEATAVLEEVERGSLLDVGCGRGEMMDIATDLGFAPVNGCEIVAALCTSDDVDLIKSASLLPYPDRSFDVVTCFDVLEHLRPKDSGDVIRQLWRVTDKTLVVHLNLLETNAGSAQFEEHLGQWGNEDLHVNLPGPEAWKELFESIFGHEALTRYSWIGAPRGWFHLQAARQGP